MNQLIENWSLIVALIVLLIVLSGAIFMFFKQPSSTQLRKVKAWLLLAVTQAEKELGSGTGKLKLRFVYDLFITKFTWIARIISFEMFTDLVEDALDEMREMLKNNPAVFNLVDPDGDV
ncbi:hypothetical protein [Sporosarcina sp. FSL K6-3457]|uniref:hypothetical protein n=1 Tax=Sporosarcina sp. FSL K6-3457 TaxID=2978204 RepID=UPI0030F935CF